MPGARSSASSPPWLAGDELIARVAASRRELLLRVHRRRLRPEDLEDAYSQAVLELLSQWRRGVRFASNRHIAAAIEQRFLSRVDDRRRAVSGRSPMAAALERAVPLDPLGRPPRRLADPLADPERVVLARAELEGLRALFAQLSSDQQLVLADQAAGASDPREFCALHGWSTEKYRKVAQRGRRRLRELVSATEAVPPVPAGSDRDTRTDL